jgi:hypothetical protein
MHEQYSGTAWSPPAAVQSNDSWTLAHLPQTVRTCHADSGICAEHGM